MKRLPLLALALLAACSPSAPQAGSTSATAAAQQRTTLHIPLLIRTTRSEHRFDVEVARTKQEQEKGLMFRKQLADDGGMLFPMNPPRTASFWMKNTVIPLDMLFIRTDGTIAFVAAKTTPYSREPVSAGIPVAAVLELRGGRAAELGIKEGDRVRWGSCVAPAAKAPADIDFCPPGAP